MRRAKLDKIDRKILKCLQDDGRMSNVNLAKEAGISAPPCLRRVRALEDNGFIQGYNAKIDPASMGYSVTVFALITLDGQAISDKEAFETYVAALPEVRECHAIAGDLDYMLKVVAHDWDDYQRILRESLTSAPNVKSVKSCLLMNSPKSEVGIPVDL